MAPCTCCQEITHKNEAITAHFNKVIPHLAEMCIKVAVL